MTNPFNPSFGEKPERFIGRDKIIEELTSSFTIKNTPWKTTFLSGQRGSGKTTLLTDMANVAFKQGVVSVSASPTDDFLNEILGDLHLNMPNNLINGLKKKIAQVNNISILGNGLSFAANTPTDYTQSFRFQLTQMLEILKKENIHVVFLIDEVQKHTPSMRTFAATYQELRKKEFPVSLIMAGLPEALDTIKRDKILTFLDRAVKVSLKNIEIPEIVTDYLDAFKESNKDISVPVITRAAQATFGYPYLIQLMGYYLWESSKPALTDKVIEETLENIKPVLFDAVHRIMFDELPKMERLFLLSMNPTQEATDISLIVKRMKKDNNNVAQYRDRLIKKGIIEPSSRGRVRFSNTYPYIWEYLEKLSDKII